MIPLPSSLNHSSFLTYCLGIVFLNTKKLDVPFFFCYKTSSWSKVKSNHKLNWLRSLYRWNHPVENCWHIIVIDFFSYALFFICSGISHKSWGFCHKFSHTAIIKCHSCIALPLEFMSTLHFVLSVVYTFSNHISHICWILLHRAPFCISPSFLPLFIKLNHAAW